jgi:NTP pyrophosphatase (non-canonical NTP hydrolase)
MHIHQLQNALMKRDKEYDPYGKIDLSFRGNELAGETGEACNIIKKLERERLGLKGSKNVGLVDLENELADVVICAALIAYHTGIDLEEACINKFNASSLALGLKTTIPL